MSLFYIPYKLNAMKKLFILAVMVLSSICAKAEDVYVDGDYGKSYNVIELGYTGSTVFGYSSGGAYLKYVRSCNMVGSLNFDFGATVHYATNENTPGVGGLLGFSFAFNLGEKVQFIPYTSANLGYRSYDGCLECYDDYERYWWDHNTEGFAFGWDVGARLKYRKVALSYTCTFGISGCNTQHFVGLAVAF